MDFGRQSTYVETIGSLDVAEAGRRVIEGMGYTGIVEIEFKRDARDGRLKLLDINPRVWGWHSLCFRAGVDFPWLLWAALRGDDLPPAVAQPGVTWLRLSTDLPTAFKEILSRRMGARPYVASLLRRHEGAIFARDDPRPGLVELPMLAATLVRRLRSDGPV
jgi:predicted ATP-grasp superfamily ATP-dependent carboligase